MDALFAFNRDSSSAFCVVRADRVRCVTITAHAMMNTKQTQASRGMPQSVRFERFEADGAVTGRVGFLPVNQSKGYYV